MQLVHELRSDEQVLPLVNATACSTVPKGMLHQKRFDQIWTLHYRMVDHGPEPSIETHNTLIDTWRAPRGSRGAQATLDAMERRS